MGLAIATKSFECSVDDGLVYIILNQPDRGNPIDGDFCREFGQAIAELSERADARAVLLSARGRLFSVGGDLMSLVKQGDALPGTIRAWTADLHVAIARMSMRRLDPSFVGRYLSRVGDQALRSVGVYQIEGEGIQLFDAIEGDHFTIVGMPLLPLIGELRRLGAIDG